MPLGYDREQNVVSVNDTADLYAYIYDPSDRQVEPDTILSVEFTVEKPDRTRVVGTGEVQDDGGAFYRFAETDLVGEYRAVATFTMTDGRKQSTRADFEVGDPFQIDSPADWDALNEDERYRAMQNAVSERVWDKLEDLFDAEDGGPWMRDMTLNVFGPNKIKDFIDEAIFDINVYNPPTNFALDKFANQVAGKPNPNITLAVQGTLIAVIRHLMRTYAEQPAPQGGQVTYEDRRDYLQRWGTIYQIEFQHYDHLVKLWKRQFLGLGQSKGVVGNKAGRLLPAPLRTRNVGRGYW